MQSWSEWFVVGLGIVLVVIGVVWRQTNKARVRTKVLEGLASRDPEVRRHTIEVVSEHGLASNASLFRELLLIEDNPRVLDALASAVVRNQWEPADDTNVVELRLWAAGRQALPPQPRPDAPRGVPGLGIYNTPPSTVPHTPPAPGSMPAGDTPPPGAPGVPTARVEGMGLSEPSAPQDLGTLVPRVQELLGGELDHVEMVSLDGEVLGKWSQDSEPTAPPPEASDEAPTSPLHAEEAAPEAPPS